MCLPVQHCWHYPKSFRSVIPRWSHWLFSLYFLLICIFTARQQSCRKVMFSQVSVCPYGECVSLVTGVSMSRGWVPIPPDMGPQGMGTHPHGQDIPTHPPPDMGYNVYIQQVGSMHPTGMCFCIYYKFKTPHHETYNLLFPKYIIRILQI